MGGKEMRVLLVEDNPGDARLVREALCDAITDEVQLDWVGRMDEALGRLEKDANYDIILVDLSLPDSQGLDTFRSIHARARRAAFIVLTGTDDEAIAMKAIECGAHDYLVKCQISGPLLAREMRYAISRQKVEEALRQAKELAESASRTKDQFLANISHEIRTPLNAVVGMVDLALATELSSEQREYLLTIESASTSLLAIIDELLDFAKIEEGKFKIDPLVMDLRENLGAILDLLAPQAHGKGLELVWHVRAGVPEFVRCDPVRFRQILINLVGNAIKFTERGEVLVEVDAKSGTDGDLMLSVTVVDTGIGVPREKMDDIFLPFVQADGSTSRRYGGTGLGLSVSARLVELMGGHIELKSEVDRGSSFHFNLALKPVTGQSSDVPVAGAELLRGMRVLVVDDNATQRRVLAELLADWQLDCETAAGGAAALAALSSARVRGAPFRVVVADSHLEDMDELVLGMRIRHLIDEKFHVILLSDSVKSRFLPDQLRSMGIAACLTKPVKPREMMSTLLFVTGQAMMSSGGRSTRELAKSSVWRRLRILLVEDNPFNQRVALLILEKRGHEVFTVDNGRDAVAAVERQRFDLALMDVQMPDLDGFGATAAIRAAERSFGRHLTIIAMTAQSHENIGNCCLSAGMDGYLAKPVQAEVLIKKVESLAFYTPEPGFSAAPISETDRIRVNLDIALDRINGDRKIFGEMAGIFLKESPHLMRCIRDGIAGGDRRQAGNAAHNLKNWAAAFVAPQVSAAAAVVEEQLDAGAFDHARSSFGPLEQNLDQLAVELDRYAKAGPTG
jgi:two-component system sensor histidine kinase/response regulator